MSSQLLINKNFLFRTFESQYDLTLEAPQTAEKYYKFAWMLLHKILPSNALKGKEILDIKGRDKNNLIKNSTPGSFLPSGDELFLLSGERTIKITENNTLEEKDQETDQQASFCLRINSDFQAFEGTKHIKHKINIFKEDVPEQLLSPSCLYEEGIKIDTLRLGMDFFFNHSLSFIGFAPEVTQTLLIEADANQVHLRINAEKLKIKSNLPLQIENTFLKLKEVWEEIFSFDILADYQKQVNNLRFG